MKKYKFIVVANDLKVRLEIAHTIHNYLWDTYKIDSYSVKDNGLDGTIYTTAPMSVSFNDGSFERILLTALRVGLRKNPLRFSHNWLVDTIG